MGDPNLPSPAVSRKSWERFGPGNLFRVRHVPIHDQSFNNFENDAIKLSVNYQLVCVLATVLLFSGFDFKIFLRARKVSGPFEKRVPVPVIRLFRPVFQIFICFLP